MSTILLASLLLPIVGAVLVGRSVTSARWVAMVFSTATLGLVGWVVFHYPPGTADVIGVIDVPWIGVPWIGVPEVPGAVVDIRFSIGIDGLSLWLYGLTGLVSWVGVLVSWKAIQDRPAAFYRLLLLLETGLLGAFVARDVILFYFFFEFTLIPLYFLVGIWGGEKRRLAAKKFILYSLAGSLLTLLGLLGIVLLDAAKTGGGTLCFSIPELSARLAADPIDPTLQGWLFWALFAGFAVKTPLFPLHTWLPLAHVEAPTAGSVDMAGILLKIGVYGFLRFSVPMLPDATVMFASWMIGLSVAGIIYGSLLALAQSDIKRLIAYSSVGHMGYCTLGIFSLNQTGAEGGILMMINHGISTGGLFALVGMLYERYHTRQIADLGGIAQRMPRLTTLMVVMALASMGLPGLNGFVGEFLVLIGAFETAWIDGSVFQHVMVVGAVSGILFCAWYLLWMIQRVFFGQLKEPANAEQPVRDLSFREVTTIGPLVVFIFWIGLHPRFFVDRMTPTVAEIVRPALERIDRARRLERFEEDQPLTPPGTATTLFWESGKTSETFGFSRVSLFSSTEPGQP